MVWRNGVGTVMKSIWQKNGDAVEVFSRSARGSKNFSVSLTRRMIDLFFVFHLELHAVIHQSKSYENLFIYKVDYPNILLSNHNLYCNHCFHPSVFKLVIIVLNYPDVIVIHIMHNSLIILVSLLECVSIFWSSIILKNTNILNNLMLK